MGLIAKWSDHCLAVVTIICNWRSRVA